jgi:succinate dehydrogenase/fumarate reductase flavoprotein subunit
MTGKNHIYDVVVAGSGAGGLATALTCAIAGLSVLVVEKDAKIGGSTAISGGAVWIPNNPLAVAMGVEDSPEAAMTYLSGVLGNALRPDMIRAFLESGPEMIAFFDAHTQVKFAARSYSPDYYPEMEGAGRAGRPIDPLPFDGRTLGADFRRLKDPLDTFTVLGGMMVNVTDVKHLLAIMRSFASLRHGMGLLLRYAHDRAAGWHRGTRLLLGNALAARLLRSALDHGVPIETGTAITGLTRDGGRVSGVRVERHGVTREIAARQAVVIATGGFPWDEARRAIPGLPHGAQWSMSPETNSGDGISVAEAAGAAFLEAPADQALWTPVSVWTKPNGESVRFPHLIWDRAKPGLIAVDATGRRFVNEGVSYHEFVRAMLRAHETTPTIPATLIADRSFVDVWGLGLALPGKRPRGHLIRDGYLIEAWSIAELASRLAMPADALAETISEANRFAETGVDAAFGKGSSEYNRFYGDPSVGPNPCLGPIRTPPFYAVRVYPGDIGTASGLATDPSGRVLDVSGRPVAGLYAAGADMASIMGGHYPAAGITLGPALTFGYRAGKAIATEAGHEVLSA